MRSFLLLAAVVLAVAGCQRVATEPPAPVDVVKLWDAARLPCDHPVEEPALPDGVDPPFLPERLLVRGALASVKTTQPVVFVQERLGKLLVELEGTRNTMLVLARISQDRDSTIQALRKIREGFNKVGDAVALDVQNGTRTAVFNVQPSAVCPSA
jgi:hypothetical protein